MDTHVEKRANYSLTRYEKAKWVPKEHIPLSHDSQTQDVASTSHSAFSDISTQVVDTLKKHLSQFSKQDFWFVHESVTLDINT